MDIKNWQLSFVESFQILENNLGWREAAFIFALLVRHLLVLIVDTCTFI